MKKEDAIKYLQQLYPNGGHCWLDEQRIEAISMAVKALQEEPISNPIDFEKELYKAFGQVKDFTLGMRIAKWFYDMGKKSREPVSEDEIEKQFKAGDVVMYVSRHPAYSGLYLLGNPNDLSIGYSNANEPYQIALRNCTVATEDERKQFMRELDSNGYKWNEDTLRIEKEEPVSEDLEEVACKYESEQQEKYKDRDNHDFDNYRDGFVDGLTHTYDAFKAGAKWQKTKDESTTEDLEDYINELSKQFPEVSFAKLSRIAVRVAKWQNNHLWKSADGDDLPDIDREVIALLDNGKVVFAHRPDPKGWDAKSVITGKVEHYTPKTYGKGGWNIPDVKYWLDCQIPKMGED